jgi:CRISPR-associated protein Csm3
MDYPHLVAKVALRGELEARTGLHIGGSDVGLSVGGADKLVVRSPRDNRPYVPGSSLKGKMRSILERAGYAKGFRIEHEGEGFAADPCQCGALDCRVCAVFGVAADQRQPFRPGERWAAVGRLIVRDAHLADESARDMRDWPNLDMPYTEVKTEVAIDRLTSKATPRNFERVPAGARFRLDLVLNLHQDDDEAGLLGLVFDGLQLLAHDFLGGQGTRGYGAVRVTVQEVRRLDIPRLRAGDRAAAWKEHPVAGIALPWSRPASA